MEVTGTPGAQYDLVVTRGADFDHHNGNFNTAQQLDGTSVVLGAIIKGGGGLQALDLQGFTLRTRSTRPIRSPAPSAASINAPRTTRFYLFGQNMAFDGTYTLLQQRATAAPARSTSSTRHRRGRRLSSRRPTASRYTGLAYLDGKLYADAAFDSQHLHLRREHLRVRWARSTPAAGSAWVGLAGDPDRNVLWARRPRVSTRLYEIDPSTGAIIKQGPDNNQGVPTSRTSPTPTAS